MKRQIILFLIGLVVLVGGTFTILHFFPNDKEKERVDNVLSAMKIEADETWNNLIFSNLPMVEKYVTITKEQLQIKERKWWFLIGEDVIGTIMAFILGWMILLLWFGRPKPPAKRKMPGQEKYEDIEIQIRNSFEPLSIRKALAPTRN